MTNVANGQERQVVDAPNLFNLVATFGLNLLSGNNNLKGSGLADEFTLGLGGSSNDNGHVFLATSDGVRILNLFTVYIKVNLTLTGSGDDDTVLSYLGGDHGSLGLLGLGNVSAGQAVNGNVATRIVLVDGNNTKLVNLGIQPVSLISVSVSGNSGGNFHDGSLGTSLTNSKAVLVVGQGGIYEVFLTVPDQREHAVASTLAGNNDILAN